MRSSAPAAILLGALFASRAHAAQADRSAPAEPAPGAFTTLYPGLGSERCDADGNRLGIQILPELQRRIDEEAPIRALRTSFGSLPPSGFEDVFRSLNSATPAQMRLALRGLESIAIGRSIADPTLAGRLDIAIGFAWINQCGEPSNALIAFRRAAETTPDEADRVCALRMLGQTLMASDPVRAAETLLEAVRLYEASRDPATLCHARGEYFCALRALAATMDIQGQDHASIDVRRRLIEHEWTWISVSGRERAAIMSSISRAAARIGNHADAVAWWDRIVAENPGHGRRDGSIVYHLSERAELAGLAPDSPEHIAALQAIWEDESLEQFVPQRARIGHTLSFRLRDAGREGERLETLRELTEVLVRNWSKIPDETRARHDLEHTFKHALLERADAEQRASDGARAIVSLEAYLKFFPDDVNAPGIRRRIDRMDASSALSGR
jgi:tetratricopeptide (TPR) repeat protein